MTEDTAGLVKRLEEVARGPGDALAPFTLCREVANRLEALEAEKVRRDETLIRAYIALYDAAIWAEGEKSPDKVGFYDSRATECREALERAGVEWDRKFPPITQAAQSGTGPAIASGGEAKRHGIYIASKTKHAARWRSLRDKIGEPIISTWIDEAGEGESACLDDLWRRCIAEASSCELLIVYREKDDVLKGAWVEVGAALAVGIPVFAVGLDEFTIAKHKRLSHFQDMKAAIAASRSYLRAQRSRSEPCSGGEGGS